MLNIIKQPPSIWFYILPIIYVILKLIDVINKKQFKEIENKKVFVIQLIILIIIDIIPLFYYKRLLPYMFNVYNIILNIILIGVYLIFIKKRFRDDKNLVEIFYKIYFEYNNIFSISEVNVKDFIFMQYGI
jgi:undecaprenyl pyrophosphate phosphatase UppP